jgi:3-methyladenine DNA glycosylase AlkC
MAAALKDSFSTDKPVEISDSIAEVYPQFSKEPFINSCLVDYESKSLVERCAAIADSMRTHLPSDYVQAAGILQASLGDRLSLDADLGMAPFFYMPHVIFVGKYGLDHFEESMMLQYELTQRFTAEFSIRSFLENEPERTLMQLSVWAKDENAHVRRLVSEGTRPRLPWAKRLKQFQEDPLPVIELLQMLKDDPSLYVRRSVANNLNDISKDNPLVVAELARQWLINASADRVWLVTHALRSAVKRNEPWALDVLGFNEKPKVEINNLLIAPERVAIGDQVALSFDVINVKQSSAHLLVDFQIDFVKANGSVNPKTFKLWSGTLNKNQTKSIRKKVSLKQMTTRKHYPGVHKVRALINGEYFSLGEFVVTH